MDTGPKAGLEGIAEGDAVEQAGEIVRYMASFRRQQESGEKLQPKELDLYLNLASQLSGHMHSIEQEDEDLRARVSRLMRAIDADPRLVEYDSCQDAYWEQHDPKFVSTLEKVTVGVLLDQFSAADSRHHVLQAIKFRMGEKRPFEEQKALYATILPRHGRVQSFGKQGVISRIVGTFLGSKISVEDDAEDPNTLVISSGDFSVLDTILNEAADMGYERVQIHFPAENRAYGQMMRALQNLLPENTPILAGRMECKSVQGILIAREVDYIPVTITLPKPKAVEQSVADPYTFAYFTRLAEAPLSTEAEQSLRFSTLNFHSFGLQFAQELSTLAQNDGTALPQSFQDQKNQCYTVSVQRTIGPYQKWTLLSCATGRRYVCSFMVKDAPKQEVPPAVNEILVSDLRLEDRVAAIDKKFRPAYTKLAQYAGNSLEGNVSLVN